MTGDNLWHCPACRRNVNATKKLSLTELWPVVVITLKRFKVNPLGQLEKLMTSVAFPTELDFDPMLPPGAPHGLYDLVGIVNQWGSLRAGHYTAATLHDGEWFDFNDRTFKPMEGPLSPSQSAYVLYYVSRGYCNRMVPLPELPPRAAPPDPAACCALPLPPAPATRPAARRTPPPLPPAPVTCPAACRAHPAPPVASGSDASSPEVSV